VLEAKSNLTLGYSSNIPFCVGLAGSSAIIVATFRALLKFYCFSATTFGDDTQWATWVMEVETQLLRIAAGMQGVYHVNMSFFVCFVSSFLVVALYLFAFLSDF
jgi:galactokinase/mevalonate kinase-like predicted kinase